MQTSMIWDVSKNRVFYLPNHPILIGFSIINHPFWGTPIFGNTHINETISDSVKLSVLATGEAGEAGEAGFSACAITRQGAKHLRIKQPKLPCDVVEDRRIFTLYTLQPELFDVCSSVALRVLKKDFKLTRIAMSNSRQYPSTRVGVLFVE